MSDGEVRVFIPSVHPVIADLSRTGEFLLSSVGLARQSYEPDYLRTQEWVDRIKDALVRGRFELTGGLQAMPDERLMQLPSDVEVVLRLGSFDVLTSVAVAKDWIQTVCDRQKAGRFEFVEVVKILEPHYGGHGKNACADVLEAFNSGALTFWMGEMPVNPIGRELPLDYGEYTTPEEVNTWLRSIKATYVFPMENMGCGGRQSGQGPQQRGHARAEEILNKIRSMGYEPKALPQNLAGKSGVKREIKRAVGSMGMWAGSTVFDKAWESLLRSGDIAYSG